MRDKLMSEQYNKFSILRLSECIVQSSNYSALHEFHSNRTIFQTKSGKQVLFTEYVESLRQKALNWSSNSSSDIIDQAYCLTIDKFSRMPEINQSEQKQKQIDCRNYFKAFLNIFEKKLEEKPNMTELNKELLSAQVMKKLVTKHFYFSLKESMRNSNSSSRYDWEINGSKITLYFPRTITGSERRKWLEENIENPDPNKPIEREKVQDIINQKLGQNFLLSLDDSKIEYKISDKQQEIAEQRSIEGLAKTIADEKAENIGIQRPAIRKLGKKQLKTMILCIFENLSDGDYKDIEIVKKFNISKATLSRFAGSRWTENENNAIPDLWRNTAQVLFGNQIFIEVAKDAGVLPKINDILDNIKKGKYKCPMNYIFIPIIANALRQKDTKKAIQKRFCRDRKSWKTVKI